MVTQEELEKMSPEEIAELQRQNCPFCKIVKGEIPSSKVFEDDDVIGILDINPAKKGHILLLPKEHIPIMPVCPPLVFKKLFRTARLISIAQKNAVFVPKVSLFIANGAVAGQQSAHFLFHLIPREPGDGLDNFSINENKDFLADQESMFSSLKNNMTLMMQRHAQREGVSYAKKSSPQESSPSPSSQSSPMSQEEAIEQRKDQIAQVIEANPQIKDLIINNPEEFKKQVEQNDQLKALFEGVDIDSLSQGMKVLIQNEILENESSSKETQETSQTQNQTESSDDLKKKAPEVFLGQDPYAQKQKVFAYFEEKPKAKELLMSDPNHFKELLSNRPDVQEIFRDVNIDKLSEKLIEAQEHDEQTTEEDSHE
jgi:histidine triad (HIT) family protein